MLLATIYTSQNVVICVINQFVYTVCLRLSQRNVIQSVHSPDINQCLSMLCQSIKLTHDMSRDCMLRLDLHSDCMLCLDLYNDCMLRLDLHSSCICCASIYTMTVCCASFYTVTELVLENCRSSIGVWRRCARFIYLIDSFTHGLSALITILALRK